MFIKSLEQHIPDLVQLVKQCLQDLPEERPTAEELLARLQRMKSQVGCGGQVRLDLARVRLAKELKTKESRIEELTQQQVGIDE